MMSSWLITTDFALKNWLLLPARSEAKSLYISRAKQKPARPNRHGGRRFFIRQAKKQQGSNPGLYFKPLWGQSFQELYGNSKWLS